jgi:hypothetical protein
LCPSASAKVKPPCFLVFKFHLLHYKQKRAHTTAVGSKHFILAETRSINPRRHPALHRCFSVSSLVCLIAAALATSRSR